MLGEGRKDTVMPLGKVNLALTTHRSSSREGKCMGLGDCFIGPAFP